MAKEIPEHELSIIMLSGDTDKALVSLVIATGAVAMGMDVVMCFTFWGAPILRDKKKKVGGKDLMGFQREEMIDYPNLTFCGVARFLEEAKNSKIQLFI